MTVATAGVTDLTAGPFRLVLVDGDVRDVHVAGVAVLQHVYVGVRGPQWDTAAVETLVERTDVVDGVLEHRRDTVHRLAAGAVEARLAVRGGPEGRLVWDLRLRAREEVAVNRAGLAVLLPDRTAAGRPYRGVLPSGAAVTGRLPFAVGPQPIVDGVLHGLFPAVRAVAVELAELTVELTIDGDELELEDQRNWTETSFKAYTRSLQRPMPYRLTPGHDVHQRITVQVRGAGQVRGAERVRARGPASSPAVLRPPAALSLRPPAALSLRTPAALPMRRPPIGAELTPGPPPDAAVAAVLATVGLDHLHVDARGEPGRVGADRVGADRVGAAAELAAALGAGLELAVEDTAPPPVPDALLRRVLVSRDGGPPPAGLVERHADRPPVPYYAAAVADFAALNRTFAAHVPRRAAFGASPLRHLADDRTMMDGPRGLHAAVCSARHAGVRDVVVAPVTLAPRGAGPGALSAADDRLALPIGAAWAAASLIWLVAARAAAVTLLATHGPAGLVDTDTDTDTDAEGTAGTPRLRPVAAVVAALCALPVGTPAAAVPERDGGPLLAAVFAPAPSRRRWLIVNTGATARRATLAAGPARAHLLDPTGAWRPVEETAGDPVVPLPPHGVALVETAPDR